MSPEVEKENQQTVGLKDNFPSLCDMVFRQEWGWGTYDKEDETQELACLKVSPKPPRQTQRQDLMKLSISQKGWCPRGNRAAAHQCLFLLPWA